MIDCSSIINIDRLINIDCHQLLISLIAQALHRTKHLSEGLRFVLQVGLIYKRIDFTSVWPSLTAPELIGLQKNKSSFLGLRSVYGRFDTKLYKSKSFRCTCKVVRYTS